MVIFTSDNGPHDEAKHNPERFNPSGPLRGMKRNLTEGGIRVPTIAWWPKTIEANGESDQPFYFGDLMATSCEIASSKKPVGMDSISFLPTLSGDLNKQDSHQYIYWEFYERTFRQAVVMKEWKLIRSGMNNSTIELYDLSRDIHEDNNLASEHPALAQRLISYMEEAHIPHPNWKTPRTTQK